MKKWTPEQHKKYSATMAAKRAEREREPHKTHHEQPKSRPKNGNSHSTGQHDAIIYLRHARKEIMKQVRKGQEMDSGHLYTLLALKALQEE